MNITTGVLLSITGSIAIAISAICLVAQFPERMHLIAGLGAVSIILNIAVVCFQFSRRIRKTLDATGKTGVYNQ